MPFTKEIVMPENREGYLSEETCQRVFTWVGRPLMFLGGLLFLSIGLLGCWASFVAPVDPSIAYDPSTTPLYVKMFGCFLALMMVAPYVDLFWGAMEIPGWPTLIHRLEKESEMVPA